MDLSFLPDIITNNWSTISTIGMAVAGTYAVKFQRAAKSFEGFMQEVRETKAAVDAALALQPGEDTVTITADEAALIAKEIQEDFIAGMRLAQDAHSVLPKFLAKKIPLAFESPEVSKKNL